MDGKKIQVDLNVDGSIKDDNLEPLATVDEFGIAANKIYNDVLFYYNPKTKTTRRRFIESWYEEKGIDIESIMKDWYEKAGHNMV
jgi:hypothetical protein